MASRTGSADAEFAQAHVADGHRLLSHPSPTPAPAIHGRSGVLPMPHPAVTRTVKAHPGCWPARSSHSGGAMTTEHDAMTAGPPGRPQADSGTATFITRLDTAGTGPRVAVKDIIDMAGVPTTAGSRAVGPTAVPARRDAACLAGSRAAGARLVGKANLHELAMLPLGTNPWFGTPVNPLDPDLIPGGSSSGSAVAVANGEADVALGSDTGGSIRIPAACCAITGLKTSYGRGDRKS